MNYTFKRLKDCPIAQAAQAWNRGFEGYFVQIEMTPELLMQRQMSEGLSLEHSIVAFEGEEPVGIIVTGFRTVGGKKMAWNGGTGIAVSHRSKGLSRLMMEEILGIYAEEKVETAALEAIAENEKAIGLYEKYGYEITDQLAYLSGATSLLQKGSILSESLRPEQLKHLPIYQEDVPWQCQWQSVKQGEAMVFYDESKTQIGYALYRRVWNDDGKLDKVLLFQLHFIEGMEDKISAGIEAVTNEDDTAAIMAVNFSIQSPATKTLLELGFKITTRQVKMEKQFS